MKTLPKMWSDWLAKKPETGMGYHVVAVRLQDGREIEDVVIVQSSMIGEVRGYADVPFDPGDITAIDLTHRRWEFRR